MSYESWKEMEKQLRNEKTKFLNLKKEKEKKKETV